MCLLLFKNFTVIVMNVDNFKNLFLCLNISTHMFMLGDTVVCSNDI